MCQINRHVVYLFDQSWWVIWTKNVKPKAIFCPSTTLETIIAHLRERFIDFYFELGLKYEDIETMFCSANGFYISDRHQKSVLGVRGHTHGRRILTWWFWLNSVTTSCSTLDSFTGFRWKYDKCRGKDLSQGLANLFRIAPKYFFFSPMSIVRLRNLGKGRKVKCFH